MSANEIVKTICDVLRELSAEDLDNLGDEVKPWGDIAGFDSLSRVEFEVELGARLGVDLEDVAIDRDDLGHRLSIHEIGQKVLKGLAQREVTK